ncbi:hypothetical protein Afil01_44310 [Actinorhabdospora filicis]|uniref:Uncharacterized protein n=1 Tax=Actinorhabdospora filicis TaxID=1785913 RepID=A0A9W6WAG1_9ACTN|nr:hypothetical protein [Actinorhabdospora filicis]GLZ79624.1 hypothetical protein Afil01_44310 [Actinorhabdospora filicis]
MRFDAAGELERFLGEAAVRAERAAALEEEVAGLVGEATSEDGLISVRADGEDPLRDLWIDTRALR